jgi:hypothetical protein
VNKPRPTRSLAALASEMLSQTFAQQGFASTELVMRWADIVGHDIAEHAEPEKIKWPRRNDGADMEPATLLLRVEGPVALEIQHLAPVILERVNRFFGFQAVGRLSLRQAPLTDRRRKTPEPPDPLAVAAVAESLPDIQDDKLRDALARLGAAIKRT